MRLGYVPILTVLMIFTSCSILRKLSNNYTENILNINIEMVEVKGGNFKMGCDEQRRECEEEDLPMHSVHLNDFYIGKYEITFEEYDLFCKSTGREKPNDNNWGRKNRPVINVNWFDATAFCEWLSKESGKNYRLPTEAEWEYAAKGGVKSKGFLYAGNNDIEKVGWCSADCIKQVNNLVHYNRTQEVGLKLPNELNIYDMSGNVWEWCSDGYDKDFYNYSPIYNPKGEGIAAVARGGGWRNPAVYCIITNRDYDSRHVQDKDLGFRVVCSDKVNRIGFEPMTSALSRQRSKPAELTVL